MLYANNAQQQAEPFDRQGQNRRNGSHQTIGPEQPGNLAPASGSPCGDSKMTPNPAVNQTLRIKPRKADYLNVGPIEWSLGE